MAAGSMRKPWRGRALVAMGTCIFSTCTEANQSHSDALLYYYIALHSQHSLSHGRVVLLIFFPICGTVCNAWARGYTYLLCTTWANPIENYPSEKCWEGLCSFYRDQ